MVSFVFVVSKYEKLKWVKTCNQKDIRYFWTTLKSQGTAFRLIKYYNISILVALNIHIFIFI